MEELIMKKILFLLCTLFLVNNTYTMAARLSQLTKTIMTKPKMIHNNIKTLWARKKELLPQNKREKGFLGLGYLKGLKAGIWYTYLWFKRDEIKDFFITNQPHNTQFYDIPDLNFDNSLLLENNTNHFTKNELVFLVQKLKNNLSKNEYVVVYHNCHDNKKYESIKKYGLLTAKKCFEKNIEIGRYSEKFKHFDDHRISIYFSPVKPSSSDLKTSVAYLIPKKDAFVYNAEYRFYNLERHYLASRMHGDEYLKKRKEYFDSEYPIKGGYTHPITADPTLIKENPAYHYYAEITIKPESGCIPIEQLYFWDEIEKKWVNGYSMKPMTLTNTESSTSLQ